MSTSCGGTSPAFDGIPHTVDTPHPWVSGTLSPDSPPSTFATELDALVELMRAPPRVQRGLAEVDTLVLRPTGVNLTSVEDAAEALSAFTGLRRLTIDAVPLSLSSLNRILEWTPPPCRSLTLKNNGLGDADLHPFLVAPTVGRLRQLHITHNALEHIPSDVLAWMTTQGPPDLSLAFNNLAESFIDSLRDIEATSFTLSSLDLAANEVEWPSELWWPALTTIDLSHTSTGLNDFAGISTVPTVQSLDIGGSSLWDEAVQQLVDRWPFPAIRHLGLYSSSLYGDLLDLALECPEPPRLTSLNLSENALDDRDIGRLVTSRAGSRLTRLEIAYNEITDDALISLAEQPRDQPWEVLRVEHNAVTRRGMDALLSSPHLTDPCRADLMQQAQRIAS